MAAFVIGGVLGIVGEVAAGLLLYQGPGLLRATTIVLAVEAGAVGIGLLSAAGAPEADVRRRMQRRLHLTLSALALAGALTWVWDAVGGFSRFAGGQGIGLAFLAALPLYLGGSAFGLMCREARARSVDGRVACGGPALLGAAAGFLLYGLVLVPRISPPVLILLCMAALSGAAVLHGSDRPDSSDRGQRRRPVPLPPIDDALGIEATSGTDVAGNAPPRLLARELDGEGAAGTGIEDVADEMRDGGDVEEKPMAARGKNTSDEPTDPQGAHPAVSVQLTLDEALATGDPVSGTEHTSDEPLATGDLVSRTEHTSDEAADVGRTEIGGEPGRQSRTSE